MAVLVQRGRKLGLTQGPTDRQNVSAGVRERDRGERVPESVDVDTGDPFGSVRIRPGDAAGVDIGHIPFSDRMARLAGTLEQMSRLGTSVGMFQKPRQHGLGHGGRRRLARVLVVSVPDPEFLTQSLPSTRRSGLVHSRDVSAVDEEMLRQVRVAVEDVRASLGDRTVS